MRPVEITPSIIADALGLPEWQMWRIAEGATPRYRPPRMQMVKGKQRPIDAPLSNFKKLLKKLHRFLQRELRPHPAVHGGAKGRSCVTAANVHKGHSFVITRDIQNCYPSINAERLRDVLIEYGFRSDTAKLLTQLGTHRGILPHGSPISSDLLNFFLARADVEVNKWSRKHDCTFTRTYDDMVGATNDRAMADSIGMKLESAIKLTGLAVSISKRKSIGLQTQNQPQLVHSIIVNNSNGVGMRDEHRKAMLELAESYVRACRSVSPDSLERIAYKRTKLTGWLYYARQLRYSPSRHIGRLLAQGDRLVSRRLECECGVRTRKWWVMHKKRNRPREIARFWPQRLHPVLKAAS